MSISDYIAQLTMDQCQSAIHHAETRIRALQEGGKVDMWKVVTSGCLIQFASLDSREALAWLGEAVRLALEQGKELEEIKIDSDYDWKSEVERYVAAHSKATPARFVKDLKPLKVPGSDG